jgi:hypothetical protein
MVKCFPELQFSKFGDFEYWDLFGIWILEFEISSSPYRLVHNQGEPVLAHGKALRYGLIDIKDHSSESSDHVEDVLLAGLKIGVRPALHDPVTGVDLELGSLNTQVVPGKRGNRPATVRRKMFVEKLVLEALEGFLDDRPEGRAGTLSGHVTHRSDVHFKRLTAACTMEIYNEFNVMFLYHFPQEILVSAMGIVIRVLSRLVLCIHDVGSRELPEFYGQ